MTRTGATDPDGDELEAFLREFAADSARLDITDMQRVAEQFGGRPDTLELLWEVAREEKLLRRLRARMAAASGEGNKTRSDDWPSEPPIPSLLNDARGSASGRQRRRISLAAAVLIAIGVALSWNAVTELLRSTLVDRSVELRTVVTRVAEVDTVKLPDGSSAILAPNTKVRYAIDSLKGSRELRLEGEAYFDVKHDDERPFRVRTRRVMVEDLGTSFVVREYGGDRRARVAVRSGAATLRSRDGSRTSPTSLRPGEGAYVDSSGAIARFIGDPESYGSWTAGRLTFDAAPLPEVLSQLARWYDVEFRLGDSTLTRQYFTGGFSSASLSKALAILGPVVHARFEMHGRVVVVAPHPEDR